MAGTQNFSPDPQRYPDLSGRAHRICRFVRHLTLWEGEHAGERFTLHRFQEAIIRRIYGPTREDGKRQVRTACIWMARGNAKTTLAAALALAHFMGPAAERAGQVVMAATDRETAGIAFRHAHQFVQQDGELASRVEPAESRKLLRHPATGGTLKAISSEAYSKQGMAASFFLVDEVHAWRPADERVFKAVSDSMVKRPNPLTVIISTAGEGSSGLAWELWEYSHAVARGEVDDPSFAPIIFAAAADADIRDERVWLGVNPGIEAGTCSLEELRIKARQMEHFPADVAFFRRSHLNQWLEGAAAAWVDLATYDAADPPRPGAELEGQPCWVGMDLSSVDDLTAVVAVFPTEVDGAPCYDVLAQCFLPADSAASKGERDRANYLRWAHEEEGGLTLTEGNVVDYAAVVRHVIGLGERYGVQEVAANLRNSVAVSTVLQEEGFTVVAVSEGVAGVAAPLRELKRAILSGGFRHGGNPVLRMCFGNAVVASDAAENERFDKSRSLGRIDGAVATAAALSRAMAQGEQRRSVYETRGLLVI